MRPDAPAVTPPTKASTPVGPWGGAGPPLWRTLAAPGTLVHGYANPLTIRRFVKLAESPKVLKMLPYGCIRATRSWLMPRPARCCGPNSYSLIQSSLRSTYLPGTTELQFP